MEKITQEITLYEKLLAKIKEITILNNALGTIYWDMETFMPKGGIEQRSEEIALMSGIIHERLVEPEIGSLLEKIKQHESYENFSNAEKRNIYLIQRSYDQQTRVPKDLVMALAKQAAIGVGVWKKAKAESNYKLFKPELEKILELTKQQAHYLNPEMDPYDVLLDQNEPGFNREIIDKLFSELRDGLTLLIKEAVEVPNQPDYSIIKRKCPVVIQKKMSEDMAKLIDFDFTRGRIDETVHPFTSGYYDDVRVTTRYLEHDFSSNLFSVLHECGHALYEQNMPKKYKYQPVGYYCSMGFHEAQARFFENIVGRSREFWEHYYPRFKELTGEIFADLELDTFLRALNKVNPSKIRIEADPVTYSLHIILRYEIEKELFAGKLSLDDLPKVWNQKMKDYLGIEIENDAEGVLQDTHWAGGGFGYFPDYALGNIYDGQLLWKMEQDIPNWREQVKKGDNSKIVKWMIEHVHQKGNLLDALDLIKEITGKELSTKYYLDYLQNEYKKLINL